MVVNCDSCGNIIVQNDFARRPPINEYVLPVDEDNTFESYSYQLCVECRRKIVDFIEDAPESEIRVDMTNMEPAVDGLEEQSKRLQEVADDLRDLIE